MASIRSSNHCRGARGSKRDISTSRRYVPRRARDCRSASRPAGLPSGRDFPAESGRQAPGRCRAHLQDIDRAIAALDRQSHRLVFIGVANTLAGGDALRLPLIQSQLADQSRGQREDRRPGVDQGVAEDDPSDVVERRAPRFAACRSPNLCARRDTCQARKAQVSFRAVQPWRRARRPCRKRFCP